MTIATNVIDVSDWLLAVPVAQAPGQTLDFSGSRFRLDLTPVQGGPVIATADSADGTLTFVPDDAAPYFTIDLRVAHRDWRIARPTAVVGDILRHPEPLNPARVEWLGRIALAVHPGSGSAGIALSAQAPVLVPAQPYNGRIVTAPLTIGPQGAPATGLPPFNPVTDAGKRLTIVNGVPAWA